MDKRRPLTPATEVRKGLKLSDQRDKPGHLARRFQQIAVAVFVDEMAKVSLALTPVQYSALAAVVDSPGIDQATLARAIAYDRATIGSVVERLTHKGMLERRLSSEDRRLRQLYVTELGVETLDAAEPAVMAAQRSMLHGLTSAEAETLMRLLRKAIDTGNELSRAPQRKRDQA
jgi:DNA-binding MarR family transcriptional regulator